MTESATFISNASTYALRSTPSPDITSAIISKRKISESFSLTSQPKDIEKISTPHLKPKRTNKPHPSIAYMVDESIFEMSTRAKGLSLFGIKMFLQQKYDINVKRSAKRICGYINESVENGRLIRKTGRGANGSFRLAPKYRALLKKKTNTSFHLHLRKAKSEQFKKGKRQADQTEPRNETPKSRKTFPTRVRKGIK